MKNLRLLQIFVFAIVMISCNKDDDNANNNDNEPLSEEPGISANINGGTYSNYTFTDAIYLITLGTNSPTMSIDAADTFGDQMTIFLNGTEGFEAGTVKNMGNIDSNNFTTYVNIRQLSSTQISYFSTSGNVTIIENRSHPTEEGKRLISGTFNVSATSISGDNTTVMTGSFTELEYVD